MPDFAGISLTRLKATPGEEDITKALENITRRQASMEETEARAAAKGEVLVCDFVGRIDGVEFQGGAANDMPIEVAGPGFIPGFTEQLEGMAPGEERLVKVSFPAEYGSAELAGKDAEFTVTAKALKIYAKPALDDELAKKLGLESMEKLREAITDSLQREYDSLSRMAIKRKLLDALAERASFTVPEGMVDNEFAQIWQRVEADMKAGKLDGEDAGKDEATLKAEYRAIAERRIRLGLLLSEIGKTNNIQVSREELGQAMRAEVQRYPGQEKQVYDFFQKNPQAIENLRSPIFEEKVVDFMLELAKVEDQTVTAEALAEAAQQA
jgi:trigger factor